MDDIVSFALVYHLLSTLETFALTSRRLRLDFTH